MTCKEFAAEMDALGIKADALAALLDRSRSAISHYRTTVPPPPEIAKKLLRLKRLLADFKENG